MGGRMLGRDDQRPAIYPYHSKRMRQLGDETLLQKGPHPDSRKSTKTKRIIIVFYCKTKKYIIKYLIK